MNAPRPIYSGDTSALIDWLERYYPAESFPAMVEKVDALISEGRLLISEEVLDEAQQKDAAVKDWCETRKDALIVPTDSAVALEVRSILETHGRLVMNLKNRNRADPFVIAVARLRRAVVVTGEIGGNESRPKIPYVCQQLGIECISFLDLIKRERWTF
jgi:hypothetical protein